MADLAWTRGTPGRFRSSEAVERGFCRECGTPLGFAFPESEKIDLTIGSFDDPWRFVPKYHFGAESMHRAWLNTTGLPETRTDEYKPLVDKWIEAVGKLPD